MKLNKWLTFTGLAFVIGSMAFIHFSPDYNVYVVGSNSMKPSITMGDVMLTGPVNSFLTKEIQTGTVVAYQHGKELIAHRVVSTDNDVLITQGDAANEPDPWSVEMEDVKGIYLLKFPGLGNVLNYIQTKFVGNSWAFFGNEDSFATDGMVAGVIYPSMPGDTITNSASKMVYRMDASEVVSLKASFWFRPHNVDKGDMEIQLFNGVDYEKWFDISDYSTTQNDTWCYFSEEMDESQYFHSYFGLRFDGMALVKSGTDFIVSDVILSVEKIDTSNLAIPSGRTLNSLLGKDSSILPNF